MPTAGTTEVTGPDGDPPEPTGGGRAARPGGGARTARRGRRIPLLVLLAVVVQLLLGVGWTFLEPSYAGLDEPNHVGGVLQLVYHHTWPAPQHLHATRGIGLSLQQVTDHSDRARVSTPLPAAQRGSYASLGGAVPLTSVDQMSQHPPLYYAAVALVVRALPAGTQWRWDRLLELMRLISAVLIAPLPLLAWATMRRFTTDRHVALAAAFVPLLLPGLARISGSVSNDTLLILLLSVETLGVARIVTGDASRRTAAWVGVAGMLALLTKGTALIVPAWLVLAYAWCWWRTRQRLWGALLTAAVPVAVGLVWWVRNLVLYHVVQPAGLPPGVGPPGHGVGHFLKAFLSAVSFRFWSAQGNPEPPQLDRSLTQDATWTVFVLAAIGLVAIVVARRQRGAAERPGSGSLEVGGPVACLLLLFSAVAVLGEVTEGSLATFHTNGALTGVQGRYLYPCLLTMLPLPLLGTAAILRGRLRPLVPIAVAVMAVLLQLAGVIEEFKSVWQPVGGDLADGVHELLLWSPWPKHLTEAVFGVIGVVAVVALAGLAAAQVRALVRPVGPEPA